MLLPPVGDWELFSPGTVRCCPEGAYALDTIAASIRTRRPGMLSRMLFGKPKGVRALKGATVYVARINKAGQLRLARPCDTCMAELKSYGIKKVVYSTDDGWDSELI